MNSGVKEPSRCNLESGSDPVDDRDSGIPSAPLQVADVRAVEPDLERNALLREPALSSERAQVGSEALANVHAATLGSMSSNSLQTISDTYFNEWALSPPQ